MLEPPIALGDTSDPTDEVTAAPQRSEEDVPAFAVLASFSALRIEAELATVEPLDVPATMVAW